MQLCVRAQHSEIDEAAVRKACMKHHLPSVTVLPEGGEARTKHRQARSWSQSWHVGFDSKKEDTLLHIVLLGCMVTVLFDGATCGTTVAEDRMLG